MTTGDPAFAHYEGTVETRLGTLKFNDGFPDNATVEKVFDNLDFSAASGVTYRIARRLD